MFYLVTHCVRALFPLPLSLLLLDNEVKDNFCEYDRAECMCHRLSLFSVNVADCSS